MIHGSASFRRHVGTPGDVRAVAVAVAIAIVIAMVIELRRHLELQVTMAGGRVALLHGDREA